MKQAQGPEEGLRLMSGIGIKREEQGGGHHKERLGKWLVVGCEGVQVNWKLVILT